MNTIKIPIIVLFMTFFIQSTSLAVDGYKEFKWNMTTDVIEKLVKIKSFCNLKDSGIDSQGIRTLYCDDFKFGGHPRHGFFLFIDNRLLRIGITVRGEEIEPLIMIFKEQFGKPSSGEVPKKGQPQVGTIGWDKDTVLLKIARVFKEEQQAKKMTKYSNREIQAVLIYTSSEFESILQKRRKDMLKKSVE